MSFKRYDNSARNRRVRKVRAAVKASGRLRLSVFRSSHHVYAQIIDDQQGKTLVAASSLETKSKSGNKVGAEEVGKLLADRAKKAGISKVAFDRGPYLYHGRVKAVGDAARASGLNF